MKKLLIVIMLFLMGDVVAQNHQTEIIPYRLVPSQDVGYGCWLEIEFIGMPIHMRSDEELMDALFRLVVSKETGEIGFHERDFKWNNKMYVLVKIQVPSPYDVLPKETIIEVDEWKDEED
jgi:hypothetical protein